MSQVMLNNVWIELTAEHILAVLRQMPPEERERVRRELEAKEWKREFKGLLARIHARIDIALFCHHLHPPIRVSRVRAP